MLPAPLSTTCALKRFASASAAARRSSFTSRVVLVQQARGLAGMRREDRGRLRARGEIALQRRVEGDRIERVGVEHEGLRRVDERGKHRALEHRDRRGRWRLSRAGPGDDHVGRHRVVHGAQHQLGMHDIHGGRVASPAGRCGPCRRRRAIAARAASSAAPTMPRLPPMTASVPKSPLWELRDARREPARNDLRREQRSAGIANERRGAEVIEFDHAAIFEAIARVQSDLVRDECDRVRRANGNAAHDARVAVQPARDVDGEDRHSARVHALDHTRQRRLDVAGKPDAQQPVDDERGWESAGHSRTTCRRASRSDRGPRAPPKPSGACRWHRERSRDGTIRRAATRPPRRRRRCCRALRQRGWAIPYRSRAAAPSRRRHVPRVPSGARLSRAPRRRESPRW